MKTFWFLSLFALNVFAFPVEEGREHGENGWYVPQLNGTFSWMGVAEWERESKELQIKKMRHESSLNSVKFYLYTNDIPKKAHEIETTIDSVVKSNFNPNNPTRFVIHGWTQGHIPDTKEDIRDAWLSRGDYNVIVVDWAYARVDYPLSVAATPEIGSKIAQMIDFLVENNGMSLDDLIVIGHSLGAHVAGFTGKNTKKGQINTIVALDAALPFFSYEEPQNRLSDTDAFYVESIHTNGGLLGFLEPIGRSAFYPNGGKTQPGCNEDPSCDHSRSTIYYAEAVRNNNFPSLKCGGYKEAVEKSCGSSFSTVRMCAATNAYMYGGDFFVPVKSKSPFGMGS